MQQETAVRVYTNPGQYQKDAQKMARQGWAVANVAERQVRRRSGCLTILTLGTWKILTPPTSELVVTYQRTR